MSSDDEGEVPPLLAPGAGSASVPSRPSPNPAAAAAASPAPAAAATAAASPSSGGGLKKGFLGGGAAASKPAAGGSGLKKGFLGGGGGDAASKPARSADMPTIRASADAKAKGLQLPEVQKSMAAEQAEASKLGGGGGSASWMTPDLMQQIAAKPILRKAFTDPRCQAAMTEMQTDPKAAMAKYADVPEIRQFLQEFMALMGAHFTKLGEVQEKERAAAAAEAATPAIAPAKSAEVKKAEEAVADAMANPEVKAILEEPAIQKLLQQMQSGVPLELDRAMRADPSMVRGPRDARCVRAAPVLLTSHIAPSDTLSEGHTHASSLLQVRKLKRLKDAGIINMDFRP